MEVSDQRIVELDGFRGAAVLLVLVWHFIGEVFTPDLGIVSQLVYGVLIFGRTGVDLFFVLSGYLIVGILIDRRQSPNLLRVFYVRRIARILPPYLLLIAIFWVFSSFVPPGYYFGDSIPLGYYLTFTQNWWMSFNNAWGPTAASVTWSVSVEEQFYLVFPLVVLYTPQQHLKKVLISVAVASVGARAGYHFLYPAFGFAPYVNTLLRLDALCVGGLIAEAIRDPAIMQYLKQKRRALSSTVLCIAAVLPVFVWGMNKSPHHTMYYWGHSYLAILYGALLLFIIVHRDTAQTAILRRPELRFFGSISYSLYLFHPLIIGIFFMLDGRTETLSSFRDAALLIAAFATTVCFSWLLFHFFEGRMIAKGHSVHYLPNSVSPARRMVTSRLPCHEQSARARDRGGI